MAFLQSALLQSQKLKKKKKKGSRRAACWGLYDCLSHSTAVKGGKTVLSWLQHKPFTPGKDWKSQYEVMECILNWFWWLKTRDCPVFHTSTNPLSPSAPVCPSVHPPPHPPLKVNELWSKARRQRRCTFKVRRGAAAGEETLFQTLLFSDMSVRLMSLESQVASFPPTNGSLDQY